MTTDDHPSPFHEADVMRHTNWIVQPDDHGIRSMWHDRCGFCASMIGEMHDDDCVIRERTVVVGWPTYDTGLKEFVTRVCDSHDPDTIEFLFNDHFDKFDTAMRILGPYPYSETVYLRRLRKCRVVYLREASVLDEERHKIRVPMSSSREHYQ